MKVLMSPQVRFDGKKIKYEFDKDIVKASFDGKEDIFDFSDMPDGVVELPMRDVETTLDINPIMSVRKEVGVLYIELMNCIDTNATEEERFPEWYERVIVQGNLRAKKWDIKRDLYDWWLRQSYKVKGGHRYFYLMCISSLFFLYFLKI